MPKVKKKNKSARDQHNRNQFTIRSVGTYISPLKPYAASSIGSYIVDSVKQFNSDQCLFPKMKTEDEIKFPFDLNIGFESYVPTESTGNSWTFLLKWICQHNFDLASIDLVVRRGVLRKIADTLFDHYKEPWTFKLCKYQNTVYFNEIETARSKERKTKETEKDKRCQYWGLNFERLVTEEPKESVSEMSSSYSVVTSTINKHRVLMRAEIDCTAHDDPADFVELKTALEPSNPNMDRNFKRNKLNKVWLQSYLCGIKNVIYGFRDNDGNITSLKHYKTSDLPKICSNYWDAGAMMSFLKALLTWALPQIEEGHTSTLSFSGHDNIILTKAANPGHFLPEWYVEYLSRSPSDIDDDYLKTLMTKKFF